MELDMRVEKRTIFTRVDYNLILAIVALNIIGLINLYSATHGAHSAETGRLFFSQMIWLAVGWIIYFIVTFVDYNLFIRVSWVLYILNILALVAVMVVGKTSLGATRWLDLGFFRYQPSETMKLALILVLSNILAKKSKPQGLGLKISLSPVSWHLFRSL